METLNIEKFDPTVAELTALVEATKDIQVTDLEDKTQLEVVRKNRIALKNARVAITKRGKELREEATAFNRAVLAKEKELIGIVEPEEDRLALIEAEAEKLAIRKERLEKLPMRKERIETAGLTTFHNKTDDDLLEMDSNDFEAYFNQLGATKVEFDREQAEIAQREKDEQAERDRQEKQRLVDEENARIKAEQDAREAELKKEQDRINQEQIAKQRELDERQKKLDQEEAERKRQQEIKEAEDRARAEEQERLKRENERIEAEKKAEQDKIEKRKAYVEFLKSHGWTEETKDQFKSVEENGVYVLWKKLGEFEK